jgi:hypothetical protein
VERDFVTVILDDAWRIDRRPDLLQPRRTGREQLGEEERRKNCSNAQTRTMCPFPPCGGRLGWGVMQRCGPDDWRSVERARLSPRYPPSSFG